MDLTAEIILERYYGYFEKKGRVYPCRVNRASAIGHACDRSLVLDRTHWQTKKVPDAELQMIYEEGNNQERAIIRDLQASGFDVLESQKTVDWPKYQLTGHYDFRISLDDGPSVLIEAKSMSPYIWQTVETYQDMLTSKFNWVRGYLAQIQIYLLLEARDEHGFFILKNKSNGQIKVIRVELDYDFAESLLQKCERINNHVANETLPDTIDDIDICERCDHFGRNCDPSLNFGEGATFIEDDEFILLLERREELKPLVKEYKELDEIRKKKLQGVAQAIAGPFLITGKENKKGSWLSKIVRMDKTEKE
jgi:hypothetical protein